MTKTCYNVVKSTAEENMFQEFMIDKSGYNDIIPLFVGLEDCAPSHSFGPHIRGHYIVHYCISGCGVLKNQFGTYHVRAGEMFVIRPDDLAVYTADSSDPWCYTWIAFGGDAAKVFLTEQSVYSAPTDIFTRVCELIEANVTSPDIYVSLIYALIYEIFSKSTGTSLDRLSQIRRHIKYHYMREDISVASISQSFGFDRSYLYKIFKARYGIGIKDYIVKLRMEKARELLLDGYSVSDTARIVGYGDEFNFSRGFKRYFKYPPSKCKTHFETDL